MPGRQRAEYDAINGEGAYDKLMRLGLVRRDDPVLVVGPNELAELRKHPGFVPKGPAMTQSQKELQKFHGDIATHVEMLVTNEMRLHSQARPEAVEGSHGHDLAFQVYRLLQGYNDALMALNEFLEPCPCEDGRDATGHRCNVCHGHKYKPMSVRGRVPDAVTKESHP